MKKILLLLFALFSLSACAAEEAPSNERGFIRDFGGREISIVASWHYLPFVTGSPVPPPESPQYALHQHMQYISAGYNVTITTRVAGYSELLANLRAGAASGRPMADMVWLGGQMIFPAITDNTVYALEEFLPDTHPVMRNDRTINIKTGAYFSNMHWSFVPRHSITDGAFLGINLELLRLVLEEEAEYGEPLDPIHLLDEGEWNFDNFRAILRRVRYYDDEFYGISGSSSDIISHLIAANGGNMVYNYRYAYDSPETLAALELASEILRYDWYRRESWHEQYYAFLDGRSVFFPIDRWALEQTEIDFDFTVVPFPAGPSSGGDSFMRGFEAGMVIPRWVDAPEEVLTVYNAIFDWSNYRTLREEERAKISALFNNTADAGRAIDIIENQGRFDLGFAIPTFYWVNFGFADAFINRNTPPAQAADVFRSPQQALLDQVLEGWVIAN